MRSDCLPTELCLGLRRRQHGQPHIAAVVGNEVVCQPALYGDQQVTTIETLGLVERCLDASPEEIDLTGEGGVDSDAQELPYTGVAHPGIDAALHGLVRTKTWLADLTAELLKRGLQFLQLGFPCLTPLVAQGASHND